jgi:hypothetical protein
LTPAHGGSKLGNAVITKHLLEQKLSRMWFSIDQMKTLLIGRLKGTNITVLTTGAALLRKKSYREYRHT